MRFYDRHEAGELLAEELTFLKGEPDVIVLAIPRGGVVVGYKIARALKVPLDVYITRKIRAPYNPELALGAVASDGGVVLDYQLAERLGVPDEYIETETAHQQEEIRRRMEAYRGDQPPLEIEGKTVILTDDGVATGSTVLASIQAIRKQNPAQLILAMPVGPQETMSRLEQYVDHLVCLSTPQIFWAVGAFYAIFDQTPDEEVVKLLQEAQAED
ncbi:MAG: phosphoribosyltransferase [Anaerolineae bacterium]